MMALGTPATGRVSCPVGGREHHPDLKISQRVDGDARVRSPPERKGLGETSLVVQIESQAG